MTIAAYYEEFADSLRMSIVDLGKKIKEKPNIATRVQSEEIAKCLKRVPNTILLEAKHLYAYELILCLGMDLEFLSAVNKHLCTEKFNVRKGSMPEFMVYASQNWKDKSMLECQIDFLAKQRHEEQQAREAQRAERIRIQQERQFVEHEMVAPQFFGNVAAVPQQVVNPDEYMRSKNLVMLLHYDPEGFLTRTYMSVSKIDEIFPVASGDDEMCHICMDRKALHRQETCECHSLCVACYHTLMTGTSLKNCPRCQKDLT
jgi:hypothetical protein